MIDPTKYAEFWAAMMGYSKRWTEVMSWLPTAPDDDRVGYWIMDFMAKELPEALEEYLIKVINDYFYDREFNDRIPHTVCLNAQLSLANLTEWMCKNVDKWAYQNCPECVGGIVSSNYHTIVACTKCKFGRIPMARWDEARRIVEGE